MPRRQEALPAGFGVGQSVERLFVLPVRIDHGTPVRAGRGVDVDVEREADLRAEAHDGAVDVVDLLRAQERRRERSRAGGLPEQRIDVEQRAHDLPDRAHREPVLVGRPGHRAGEAVVVMDVFVADVRVAERDAVAQRGRAPERFAVAGHVAGLAQGLDDPVARIPPDVRPCLAMSAAASPSAARAPCGATEASATAAAAARQGRISALRSVRRQDDVAVRVVERPVEMAQKIKTDQSSIRIEDGVGCEARDGL